MGRLKKAIEKLKEQETSELLKEFNVKITDDRNKLICITYVKAKTKESALNKVMEDYKNKPYNYYVL